jgi:hypothetical protein
MADFFSTFVKICTMKRTAIPLLLMMFGFCYCSDNPNAASGKEDRIDPNDDPSAFAKAYIDSLRPQSVNLANITDIKTLLCQQWEHKEDKEEVATYGGSGSFVTVYRGMAFFNDGSVVRNPRSYISLGTWQYDDEKKIISINLKAGDNYRYKIMAISANELKWIDLDETRPNVETYVAQSFSYKQNELDPFYGANNQWRIKPGKPETPEQINKRVKDCVRFYSLFYNDNLLRDTAIISFVGLPSCFNWYSSGIGVQAADKLSDEWKDCFYDKAQALKAHALLENLITQKYQWTKGRFDWRVKTAKVLQQMIEKSEILLK